MKNDIRGELRSLLRDLEEEAKKREEVKTDQNWQAQDRKNNKISFKTIPP